MENKQAHAGNENYDENFYRELQRVANSAANVLKVVSKFIRPRSVVDLGCGVGSWLEYWQKNFGAEVHGIDGDYVDKKWLCIAERNFHPFNLEERINLNRRFDLAMTIEVAEHLTPARADSFIEDLTKLSDVILFSAAIPAQGGVNHINEQWQSYWAEKFLRLGYVAVDCIRPTVWDVNYRVEDSHRQNIFIYVKSTELYRYPELHDFYLKHRDTTIYDLVHPITFFVQVNEFNRFRQEVQNHLANQR
ncbi:MAG: class I SAM-dependent methyltransferase [Selenomonadaceae bacterium]|nr:class I SAM-dependent methyltransferase [Selenomonadaceae bacterium]